MAEVVPAMIREAYRRGYQDAIDTIRSWHDRFGKPETSREFATATAMTELAKPSAGATDG